MADPRSAGSSCAGVWLVGFGWRREVAGALTEWPEYEPLVELWSHGHRKQKTATTVEALSEVGVGDAISRRR
jgi:hypothetical protein